MTDKNYTHFSILADRTGSMDYASDGYGSPSKAEITTKGIKDLIKEQAALDGKTTFTLVDFDTVARTRVAEFVSGNSGLIADWNIVPRGGTPLLDAVGEEIVLTGEALAKLPEDERPGRVFFVIGTDGEENASKEYTKDKISKMVKTQTEEYSWEFIFIGADIDAFEAGGGMGFRKGSTLESSGATMDMAYVASSSAITRSRLRGGPVSYNEAERSMARGA